MTYNAARTGDSSSDGSAYGHESSTGELATAGSPYLDFINQSFSTDRDLSLPDRDISSPVLDQPNPPYASSSTLSPSPRERILNNLFKRGSKETLSKETLQSSSTSSPVIPSQQQASPTSASGKRSNNSSSSIGGSSSTLSSPAIPKSILKQSQSPTNMHSSLPTIPSARSSAVPLQQQQPRPQTPSQQYQQATYLSATGPMTSSSLQRPYPSAPVSQVDETTNLQSYMPPPPSSSFNNNSNRFSVDGLTRPASPFAKRPSSQGSGDVGTYTNNTNSLSSTHRSSHNFGPGTDNNYNVTQSDLTLDALAQRWQAYQAVMKKQYSEEPFYRRWTKSKWMLLLSTTLLLAYSCAVLVVSLGYLTHRLEHAAVMMEFHSNLIILALAGSVVAVASALIGFLGIFRENRSLLTIYTTLLWAVFALYVSVGYIAFRREKNHLNQRLRDEWIHDYTRDQRLLVQRQFKCCGFISPISNGEYDMRCFPMINLPGCQFKYREYERDVLTTSWTTSFSIIPLQLFIMIVALLCSNHVDSMLRSARPGLKSFKEEKEE